MLQFQLMRRKSYRYRQSHSVDFTVEERATLGGLVDRLAAAASVRIQLGRAQPVVLPMALKPKLLALLRLAAEGQDAQIEAHTPTLTTQQVAERLGVSRPHVVALIAKGDLPATKVGTHRRIRLTDLQAYQTQMSATRSKALTTLMRETRRLRLGY